MLSATAWISPSQASLSRRDAQLIVQVESD
jgi:hypothetical protein